MSKEVADAITGRSAPLTTQPNKTTVNDVGNTYAKWTLKEPNSYMPKNMTGALPHALLMSGLGYLGGNYLLPWALKDVEGIKHDRIKRIGGILGALGMAGVTAPGVYTAFQAGRGRDKANRKGPWSDGFKGLFGGLDSVPIRRIKSASIKEAGFWDGQSIDVDAMTNTIVNAAANGRMSPAQGLAAIGVAERSRNYGTGMSTPRSFASAAAGRLLKAGIGASTGYAIGKVVGTLAGAFGMLGPKGQKTVSNTGAIISGIANAIA